MLIRTGPPGAGKSSVARLVTEDAPRAAVHLHTDSSFYVWIRTGFVPPYLPEAARQNDVVLGVIAEAACGYARGGYDVEPLKGVHAAFGGLGEIERHVLDTTSQTVEETADAVRNRGRSAAFSL
ncbi:hypothetical protein [Amycolatopsis vancoresmycina]|uniref:UDP-N-acetylglucosamine kinase n=1 Tax=Amycolatopsis vancoresmycina DSM 44592 TaxID=1292037 RepID=R1I9V3_9PSEU|nr:hypothetical protein [Amycolatopsis vancoresmycina]EOD67184.1 hypothetical protein H480_17740 [Amycolatopsis vancoresmycina DSM 44592]